jgi:hypothetical protein
MGEILHPRRTYAPGVEFGRYFELSERFLTLPTSRRKGYNSHAHIFLSVSVSVPVTLTRHKSLLYSNVRHGSSKPLLRWQV